MVLFLRPGPKESILSTDATIDIIEANLDLTIHSQAVLELLNAYAGDPMGNGSPLPPDVLKTLIPGLQQHPGTIIFIAFRKNKPVGVVTCFRGFSTFMAKPLLNISDFYVLPDFRGSGAGKRLLGAVEKKAVSMGCCKITLEVQENNATAIAVYTGTGFNRDVHTPEAGPALFFSKSLA